MFLDWTNEHKYSYNEIIPGLKNQIDLITAIDEKDDSDKSPFEKQLIELSHNAIVFEELSYMKNIKLIPPALLDENAVWQSPFDFIISGVTPAYHQEEILNSLQKYLAARFQKNNSEMNNALARYETITADLPISSLDVKKLKSETWMNEVDLFVKSLAFYILSFLLIGVSWMVKPTFFRNFLTEIFNFSSSICLH